MKKILLNPNKYCIIFMLEINKINYLFTNNYDR